jgi:hypothetical protein
MRSYLVHQGVHFIPGVGGGKGCVLGDWVPAAHVVHLLAPSLDHVPAGQSTHLPPTSCLPPAHFTAAARLAVSGQTYTRGRRLSGRGGVVLWGVRIRLVRLSVAAT